MQKIKLKQEHLQGSKHLSRVELGNIFGGALLHLQEPVMKKELYVL